jgi:hypothetical protein
VLAPGESLRGAVRFAVGGGSGPVRS